MNSETLVRKHLIASGVETFTAAIIAQAAAKLPTDSSIEITQVKDKVPFVRLLLTSTDEQLIEFATSIHAIEQEGLIVHETMRTNASSIEMGYKIPVKKLTDKQTERLMEILRLKWFTITPNLSVDAHSISSEIGE